MSVAEHLSEASSSEQVREQNEQTSEWASALRVDFLDILPTDILCSMKIYFPAILHIYLGHFAMGSKQMSKRYERTSKRTND